LRKQALHDEKALIAAFLKGEPAALRKVDSWISSELWIHLGRSPEGFEDLRQEVELRLLQNLRGAGFRGRSSLQTYIRRIAANVGTDYQRRTIGQRKKLERYGTRRPSSSARSAESAYLARDLARTILSQLSADDRLLIWLVFGERYSYEEAARRLGKSVGATRLRAHRARRKIQERFKRE